MPREKAMLSLPLDCQSLTGEVAVLPTYLWKAIMPRVEVQRCSQFQSPVLVEQALFMSTSGTVVSVAPGAPASLLSNLYPDIRRGVP